MLYLELHGILPTIIVFINGPIKSRSKVILAFKLLTNVSVYSQFDNIFAFILKPFVYLLFLAVLLRPQALTLHLSQKTMLGVSHLPPHRTFVLCYSMCVLPNF